MFEGAIYRRDSGFSCKYESYDNGNCVIYSPDTKVPNGLSVKDISTRSTPLSLFDDKCVLNETNFDMTTIQSLLKRFKIVDVCLKKSSRGLGMRICGGIDNNSNDPLDKLIRVKSLFPSEPAIISGLIDVGDIIIEVNGKNMIGITSIESLNLLHSNLDSVNLKVLKCGVLIKCSNLNEYTDYYDQDILDNFTSPTSVARFDITLVKKDGSLGFTIAKIESEGFFIKELTKEPAILDNRIAPWDKLIRVNGIDISSMTWTGAITYLRSLPDKVNLTLERTNFERPDSPIVEEEINPLQKKQLRHEAMFMITQKSEQCRNRRKLVSKSKENLVKIVNDDDNLSESTKENLSHITSDLGSSPETLSPKNSVLMPEVSPIKLSVDSSNSLDQANITIKENPDENINRISEECSTTNNSSGYFESVDCALDKSDHFHKKLNLSGGSYSRILSLVNGRRKNTESSKGQNFMRWRGKFLNVSEYDVWNDENRSSTMRDEQDSGFGESKITKEGDNEREDLSLPDFEGQVISVELKRGWHSRLGFSLVDCVLPNGVKACCVKSVFANSLAEKDGRIKVGDILIQVNFESLINRSAEDVIDNLRKIRGKMSFLFIRNATQSHL